MRVEDGPSTVYDALSLITLHSYLVIFRLPPSDLRPPVHTIIFLMLVCIIYNTKKPKNGGIDHEKT